MVKALKAYTARHNKEYNVLSNYPAFIDDWLLKTGGMNYFERVQQLA